MMKTLSEKRLKIAKRKKYLNKLSYKTQLAIKGFLKERQIRKKIWQLIVYVVEVLFTGTITHYALTHFNPFSVGTSIALIVYYVEWFIKIIKRKENNGIANNEILQ